MREVLNLFKHGLEGVDHVEKGSEAFGVFHQKIHVFEELKCLHWSLLDFENEILSQSCFFLKCRICFHRKKRRFLFTCDGDNDN